MEVIPNYHPDFFGLYKILKRVGLVAFNLELPSDSKVHLVFHVSFLRLVFGTHIPTIPTLLPKIEILELELALEKVLDHD